MTIKGGSQDGGYQRIFPDICLVSGEERVEVGRKVVSTKSFWRGGGWRRVSEISITCRSFFIYKGRAYFM